ncbi:peptidase C14, caspase catalytic subunit p20 [Sinorhizobium meliloti]|nr:peptidase C14, caspase catalytic subunit p20 [Sinorhizobium meliloti]MDW9509446.1 peptidase C14, caspase catalytic subunit p20 [Sinorhizobium meliloti]MDX0772327.1 peptidase C14, caspase catalytic subunit p20 [Sinorhizobium medicae]MDX0907189.1 peptidase C14, caspase catalytic subunit p20 [Sinorhizobium medicae]MDX1164634.1 peptidase C14, caspase catalytic subunit p20 [Sinorhizobium medicae]
MASNSKISLEELNRKLADPNLSEQELQKYFLVDDEKSGPFNPVLEINREEVTVPMTPEGRARSAALLNSANFISRLRRQAAFHNRIGSGDYKGPVIVSEGDSWFQYPFRLMDVIDQLMKHYAVFSLDAAGDTLSNMLKQTEYMDAIENTGASIFLFSGGGNDVVAGGNLAAHLFDFDPALPPEGHLRPSFETMLDDAIGMYGKLVRQVATAFPKVQILCHGYDYTIPAKGRWLGKPMETRGIKDPAVQRAIARVMIDRFNERLSLLQSSSARLNYIDCRNTVSATEWFDELHPMDMGYSKVAQKFAALIQQFASRGRDVEHKASRARAGRSKAPSATTAAAEVPSRPAAASSRATHGPSGISLHIGLNAVSPAHYAGWEGPLRACEFDASDMQEIADGLGYETKSLLTKEATRQNVIREIKRAAKDLRKGDIFFISYSAHGGQLPDFNNDEDDATDETWCLYDGQLVDDELYELWSEFKEGVRVLVISDSCHSGTVVRAALPQGLALANGHPVAAGTPRAMPLDVATRTYRQNRDFYTRLGASISVGEERNLTREITSPISCSVRLISGCQDNQVSLDGIGNGAFTAALISTWNHGRFNRNYAAFHRAIMMKLPPDQTPHHWQVGPRNPIYDAQTPFAI